MYCSFREWIKILAKETYFKTWTWSANFLGQKGNQQAGVWFKMGKEEPAFALE